jgi:hypothetical protein
MDAGMAGWRVFSSFSFGLTWLAGACFVGRLPSRIHPGTEANASPA